MLHVNIFKRCSFFFFFNTEAIFWRGLCWVFLAAHGLFIAERRFSPVGVSRGYPLVVVHGLLTVVASLVAEHGL